MGRQARQQPFDVAIQDRQRCVEGTGKDAAGGGAADARQGHPTLQAVRPRLAHQQLRPHAADAPASNTPGPATATAPHPETPRPGPQQWKHRHPAPPVGERHGQLALLQNHLSNPDAVGIESCPGAGITPPGNSFQGIPPRPWSFHQASKAVDRTDASAFTKASIGSLLESEQGPSKNHPSKCFARQDASAQQPRREPKQQPLGAGTSDPLAGA